MNRRELSLSFAMLAILIVTLAAISLLVPSLAQNATDGNATSARESLTQSLIFEERGAYSDYGASSGK